MLTSKDLVCTLGDLVSMGLLEHASGLSRENWDRISGLQMPLDDLESLTKRSRFIGVTTEFAHVTDLFKPAAGIIPAGFRPVFRYGAGQVLNIDLVRDISYAENGIKRPTKVLFSADSANPYEVAPLRNMIANLTCNPAIIYNSFINNPKANVGNRFKDRYEVMAEICRIVGPGVDISVEVDNPFAPESEILEEISRFEEILSPYRLVVKVPHTGPVNKNNVPDLLSGNFPLGYEEGSIEDSLYGNNLACNLSRKGYRINFTLMFEPYQAALALQSRPYFINAFIKQRHLDSLTVSRLLNRIDGGEGAAAIGELKAYMRQQDMLSAAELNGPDDKILEKARFLMAYRRIGDREGQDGLDSARHGLRLLRQSNLDGTRLIICSMSAYHTYPAIDKMLMEPEFADMLDRVVITAPPAYLAQFTSAPGVLFYQRLFLGAVK